ncbi:hypothetical protein [Luteimonas marina]|nr:hypothetical protein [Luteimonas marina]
MIGVEAIERRSRRMPAFSFLNGPVAKVSVVSIGLRILDAALMRVGA